MLPHRTALNLLLAVFVLAPSAAAQSPPSYLDAPVFMEMHPNDYGDHENRELLPQGKISLKPLGVEDITNFDWRHHARDDASWWNRIENFFYLCPLLSSHDDAQRRFVNTWFDDWYSLHQPGSEPNPGAWDGMTAGQRAMVLTWILKLESNDPLQDTAFSDCLVASLAQHQQHLVQAKNFEANSNHGMWQALGLLETTRVVANDSAATIALERLAFLADKSVSKQGVHREHSPGYHFTFVKWLAGYVPYLEALYPGDQAEVVALRRILENMHAASYYLYDHHGRVPQIGDSSLEQIPTLAQKPQDEAVLFDPQAGFAIYKDLRGSSGTRYVVFNIQNQQHKPTLPFHYHDDALAIFYSDDGETIIDDAGRLTYRNTPERRFVKSSVAHSTVLAGRYGQLFVDRRTPRLADETAYEIDGSIHTMTGQMFIGAVTRTVSIDPSSPGVKIVDRLQPPKFDAHFAVVWQIGRDVVSLEEVAPARWHLVTRRGRRFEMSIRTATGEPPHRIKTAEGQSQPLLGWRAEGYENFVPAKTIVAYFPRKTAATMTTLVLPLD